jgi:hypothetical protein
MTMHLQIESSNLKCANTKRMFESFRIESTIFHMVKYVQFVLLVILQPTFSLIGVFNKNLTILVILNKNKKNEYKESMCIHGNRPENHFFMLRNGSFF